MLSNRIDRTGPAFSIAGNFIHCDCNTEKMLKVCQPILSYLFYLLTRYSEKICLDQATLQLVPTCHDKKNTFLFQPWLLENFKNIPDYKMLECDDNVPVVDLVESQVCHTPRDWTDYIYYIIGLEVLILVLLISKVSYDYWVFKTAGYLPWPANKMPRLPCDWLCE